MKCWSCNCSLEIPVYYFAVVRVYWLNIAFYNMWSTQTHFTQRSCRASRRSGLYNFSDVFCLGRKLRIVCVWVVLLIPPLYCCTLSVSLLQQRSHPAAGGQSDGLSVGGSRALDWDPEWPVAKYKRNKVLQFCPCSQLAFTPTAKKRIFITRALRKDAQSCSLEAGSWRCESSGMLGAYKCPLTGLFFPFQYSQVLFLKSRPH